MDTSIIDIKSLPSLPLSERKQLPTCSVVYFVFLNPGEPLYIGKAVNMRQRWSGHHRYKELEEMGDVSIAWMEVCDLKKLGKIETELIKSMKPSLNKKDIADKNKFRTVELRSGFVSLKLYEECLIKASVISLNKSQVAIRGLMNFLSGGVIESIRSKILEVQRTECEIEFRAYIPLGLYNLAMRQKENLGLSNSQLMTIALSLFVNDLAIQELYEQYLNMLSDRHGITTAQIEQTIFDYRRLQARMKRLELSKAKGEFITDRKIAT